MSNKKARTVCLILGALSVLHVNLNSMEMRRLVVFVKDTGNETAAVKKLRNIVNQFRLDPHSVMSLEGVGTKTFETVQKLAKLLAAEDTKRDYGLIDNTEVVRTILSNMNAYMPPSAKKAHDDAKSAIQKLAFALNNHDLERNLQQSVKVASRSKKVNTK